MIVAVSGSTGLIGSVVSRVFGQRGHIVRPLVRREARTNDEIAWNPERETIDAARLEGVDAVINLAGETLAQRTRVCLSGLDFGNGSRQLWEAAAAVPFTAFCAAAEHPIGTSKNASGYRVMGYPGAAPNGYAGPWP